MVTAILDTAILVDLLRKFPPAIVWSQMKDTDSIYAITPIIWMEVINGTRNKQEQQWALKLLRDFQIVSLTAEDIDWARDVQLIYQLSRGVGVLDCLIAAPCIRLKIPLYTRNLKHLSPLLNNLAIQPY